MAKKVCGFDDHWHTQTLNFITMDYRTSKLHVGGKCRDQFSLATDLMAGLTFNGEMSIIEPASTMHANDRQHQQSIYLTQPENIKAVPSSAFAPQKGRQGNSQPEHDRIKAATMTQGMSQFTQTLNLCVSVHSSASK